MKSYSSLEEELFHFSTNRGIENIQTDFSTEVYDFVKKHNSNIDFNFSYPKYQNELLVFESKVLVYLENHHMLNNQEDCNNFFREANLMLCLGGMFICFVETYKNRKTRIFQKYNSPWSGFVYTWDTLRYRVMPKIPFTEKIFNKVTGGKGKLMSGVEALGRLYAAGFELIEEKEIGGYLYFAARKIQKPMKVTNATYWPVVKLKRIGIAGKEFNVYKLRTMYPYSEFLQDMVYQKNKLTDGGKFKDDFRVSRFGKLLRKIWLDEVPMIWNLLRGDIKLVGVRPLSKQYFNLYHAELKQKRTQYKPGLIPPYFADMPSTLEEIMESEMRYLNAYSISPISTDFKYFFKIFKNILFKGARSR